MSKQTDRIALLEALLKEADNLLVEHHEASLCTWEGGMCPVCSKGGRENYPDNIFGRIERALKSAGK